LSIESVKIVNLRMLFKRSILFLLAIHWMVFASYKTFLVMDWKLNQDAITEKYCENKDVPMLECNGQCYLAKQLKALKMEEQSERDKHPSPESKLKHFEITFLPLKLEEISLSYLEKTSFKQRVYKGYHSGKSCFLGKIPIPPPRFC